MSAEDEEQSMIQDWQAAVEDLKDNVRHEILTLTNLARELTNIAYPIAEILEQHIKKAPPQRKLPAIYLLDSIVKNVGTPYTLFFGKNLYSTYMEVYASVDQKTRHKLEEMLQTWKEPVPGSIDSTPVFSPDVVRPIENALIKARTSALQVQQEQARSQMRNRGGRPLPGALHRSTPTPPNARPPFSQPPAHVGINGQRPESAFGQQQYPQPQPGLSIDSLNNDMDQLIVAVGAALGRSPHSSDTQAELTALLALQGLLRDKHRNLPQDQLVAVRNQVDQIAVKYRVSFIARQSATAAAPPFHAPMHHQQPQQQQRSSAASVAPVPPPSAPPAPVSLDSLLGKGTLAALLSRQSATPQPQPPASTPQIPPAAAAAVAALRSPTPQRVEPQKSATPDPMALLASLRGAGLLSNSASPSGQTLPGRPFAPPPAIPSIAATAKAGHVISSGDISLTVASLKQPRPHLVHSLYEALGPQCTQCGRRFPTDEEGKKKKTAHMDWHFRVKQRMVEAEQRGQHRSWYVDQADWIHNVETIDLEHVDNAHGPNANSSQPASSAPKIQWIPVPDDGDTINTVCPICQEKFQTKWLDEAQEWVWTDTTRVGGRAFHASCYAEVTKESGATPLYGGGGSRVTPDRVLGKRKAEDEILSLRGGRVKTDA
ncbi:hypothetical protein M406DRAFT_290031 [Cryphonectria parasitica EP155]|uniref:CID domain-containing protein n=1 Tax=Cryphonectria parasitica (strain ATCC 38755 / EP155) TaxID=660469 RepID=A0A9P4Y3Q0_CRYP1|nr:uncharacterized protein M406DRAFT_290031 [Cryphonectria parasitica EP155]KAF3765807.1 hypothetical protein M406DRAFT_290031 [Cryphonectria parasitica EP155]